MCGEAAPPDVIAQTWTRSASKEQQRTMSHTTWPHCVQACVHLCLGTDYCRVSVSLYEHVFRFTIRPTCCTACCMSHFHIAHLCDIWLK